MNQKNSGNSVVTVDNMQADDGSVITGPEEMVEHFNNYFFLEKN